MRDEVQCLLFTRWESILFPAGGIIAFSLRQYKDEFRLVF